MNTFSFKLRNLAVPFLIVCAVVLYIFFRRRPDQLTHHGRIFTDMHEKSSARISYEVNIYQEIIQSGHDIMKKSDVVLFGMLNDAYVPFTYSWLCNTLPMAVHGSVLLLTTDKNSTALLKRDWPEIHTIYLPVGEFRGDQEYSKAGYVKMMHIRTQIIHLLLRSKIPLLLFETDCLWISNPIPEVVEAVKGHDILVVKPTHLHGYLGGFMCLMATEPTLKVWGKLSDRMLRLYNSLTNLKDNEIVADETNDQVFFSSIMEQEKNNIKVYVFSNKKIVDGKWYIDFTEKDRKEMNPLIINNNWVRGNAHKITRAKEWGHWFVSDSLQCNMKQVDKIIKL